MGNGLNALGQAHTSHYGLNAVCYLWGLKQKPELPLCVALGVPVKILSNTASVLLSNLVWKKHVHTTCKYLLFL